MAANQTINFKDLSWVVTWLDTALKKEKEKYKKCPVMPDLVPDHQVAQGWGYVVAGYFLVEESFYTFAGKMCPKDTRCLPCSACSIKATRQSSENIMPTTKRPLEGAEARFRSNPSTTFLKISTATGTDAETTSVPLTGDTSPSRKSEARKCHWSAWIICTKSCSGVYKSSGPLTTVVSSRLYLFIAGGCNGNGRRKTESGCLSG